MFSCGTNKKKSAQVPVVLEDKCKEHNQPFDFVSLALTNKNLSVKACPQCKVSRSKEEFISFKDIKLRLQTQQAADIAGEYKVKLTPLLNETEYQRKKLINLADEIYESIMQGIQDLFVHSIIKQLPNQLFTFFDVFDLIQAKTLEDFTGIVDQMIQFNKADETSLALLAKVICKEKEAQDFLDALPKEIAGIKKKLEKIHADFGEMNNLVKRTVEQTKKQNIIVIPKIDLTDPVLNFMSQQQENHAQDVQQMKGLRGRQIKPVDSEKSENPLIKQIIEIGNEFIAYSTGTKIMIFDSTKNFQYLQQLDCENDVTAICALKVDQTSYIISSVEEAEDVFQLIFWDWRRFDNNKVVIAHEKYIWNIINLPQQWIATCSEDMTIKVFDGKNQKEMTTIAVHQASVNDIALVNQEVIVSVSDDGMVAASNYKNGDFRGMAIEDCEIKCVIALDGIKFATGNSNGEVRIYVCTQQIELQTTIKIHEAVVRFMSRVDAKSFVTSSWDGTHWFLSANGEKLKQIAEGPRKNFSEPLLWTGNSLLGSSGGYLYLYQ